MLAHHKQCPMSVKDLFSCPLFVMGKKVAKIQIKFSSRPFLSMFCEGASASISTRLNPSFHSTSLVDTGCVIHQSIFTNCGLAASICLRHVKLGQKGENGWITQYYQPTSGKVKYRGNLDFLAVFIELNFSRFDSSLKFSLFPQVISNLKCRQQRTRGENVPKSCAG